MSDGRALIFSRIRHALAGRDEGGLAAARRRVATPPKHPLPARARTGPGEARAQFTVHLEAQGVTVTGVADTGGVPAAIKTYLATCNPDAEITHGSDPWLEALEWQREPDLKRRLWRAGDIPVVGLSRAAAGAGETGTLVMASGGDNPATLYYLPETHIVAIEAAKIFAATEEAIAAVRQLNRPLGLPRTMALISAASRTADVGGKLVRGAHGPKRLAVIIVG